MKKCTPGKSKRCGRTCIKESYTCRDKGKSTKEGWQTVTTPNITYTGNETEALPPYTGETEPLPPYTEL